MFTRIKEIARKANARFLNQVITYELVIPRLGLDQAEYLCASGDLQKIKIKDKFYYLEYSEELEENVLMHVVKIWPTKWGYEGRRDGHEIHATSIKYLLPILLETDFIIDDAEYLIDESK